LETIKIYKDKGFRVLQFNMFATEQCLPVLIPECVAAVRILRIPSIYLLEVKSYSAFNVFLSKWWFVGF